MDFSLPAEIDSLAKEVRAFVEAEVVPYESDPRWTAHGPTDALRRELNAKAKAAGLLAPQVAEEFGGRHLTHLGQAAVFEAAGWSMLGPIALHFAAPDEGNIHLLDKIATPAQRQRWLEPLATARERSCFCMTEPAPGAGADPGQLATTARREGNGFVIDGLKWLITGVEGAKVGIVMARLEGEDGGPTMFMTDMDREGITVERVLDTIDGSFTGGHGVVRFEGLKVDGDEVLGEVGKGLRYAQVRLAPARLTHCMRWLGSAVRANAIAADYARRRTAFGSPLAEHGQIAAMLADNAMDLHGARLVVWHTAWVLDQGGRAGSESSMAKVMVSEAVFRVADRCVQILGGLGVTRDTVVERIFREARAFRIYDGPSEVHRWALGKRIAKGAL